MNETVKKSKCCNPEVDYRARGFNWSKTVKVPHRCKECQMPCFVVEVCIHCEGTGEMRAYEAVYPGESHMADTGTQKCICQL